MIRPVLRLIKAECAGWLEGLVMFLPRTAAGNALRRHYWQKYLANDSVRFVGLGARIFVSGELTLGERFELGDFSTIEVGDSDPVYIGNDVSFARGTYVRSANHRVDDLTRPAAHQGHTSKQIPYHGRTYSIVVEDNVWIAAHSVILTGSKIGEGAVISAGSVVSSEVPPFSIVAGNPARVIGSRAKRTGQMAGTVS